LRELDVDYSWPWPPNAAFPRTYSLGRIAPSPLNIATALHAEAMEAVSLDATPPGKLRTFCSVVFLATRLMLLAKIF